MSIAIAPEEIEKVTRTNVSASGAYRKVWFLGDIVIKKDGCHGSVNESEFDVFSRFVESTAIADFDDGCEYTFKVPEMAMVGEYLIAQKIDLPEFPYWGNQCNDCVGDSFVHDCIIGDYEKFVRSHVANHYHLYDMHTGNWRVDTVNKIVWLIDIAQ